MYNIAKILTTAMVTLGSVVSAHSADVTLRVEYAFSSRDGVYRQMVADEFMRLHPHIHIKLETSAKNCPALLQQTLLSSMTDDLPDIIESVCYPDMPILANRGIPTPLNDFMSTDKTWPAVGLTSAALGTVNWKGKTIALPENVSTSIVYYNMSIIKKARPDFKDLPKTWDDILKLASEIGKKDTTKMGVVA